MHAAFHDLQAAFAETHNSFARIKLLLEAATRAPSTHNSQPWIFHIRGDTLQIYLDTSIELPRSDPSGRYAHVSIGFLMHHIVVLAQALGMRPHVTVGRDALLEIHFSSSTSNASMKEMAQAIFTRRNRRGIFLHSSIPFELLTQATQYADYYPDGLPRVEIMFESREESIQRMADLTGNGIRHAYALPEFRAEMSRWITSIGSAARTGLPYYSLNVPALLSVLVPSIIRFCNVGARLAALNRRAIGSASAVFGIGTEDSTHGWLASGYVASHAILTLESRGVSTSIFVAAIECTDTRTEAAQLFNLHQPLQFHFAAGYFADTVSWRTPRVAVEKKLR